MTGRSRELGSPYRAAAGGLRVHQLWARVGVWRGLPHRLLSGLRERPYPCQPIRARRTTSRWFNKAPGPVTSLADQEKWHALAAFVKAGELTSMLLGTSRNRLLARPSMIE